MISRIGRMRPASKRSAAAFTLIEIMLVVILLAVVTGLAVPSFKTSWQRLSLQQAVNRAAYIMRYAQSRAIKNDRQEQFVLDTDGLRYSLKEQIIDADDPAQKKFGPIAGKWGQIFNVPAGVSLESAQKEVVFYPDGKIDRVRVVLCRQEECMTVSTKEQTGFVDVYDGRLEP